MQFDDVNRMGGGVQVYLQNIIKEQRKEHQIISLSGGTEYDLSGKCKIKKIKEENNVSSYSIINSPMLAPSKASFYELDKYLRDQSLSTVLETFLKSIQPVDVVHIHSFEGLTLACLKLKEKFPQVKFITTLHNYYPFCPQVNLWKHDMDSCDGNRDGQDCISCCGKLPSSNLVRKEYIINTYLKRAGLTHVYKVLIDKVRSTYKKHHKQIQKNIGESEDRSLSPSYADFRKRNIEYMNEYFDDVICVSNRVRDIAVHFGVKPDLCKVLYIGTSFAEKQKMAPACPIDSPNLTMIYMGYMRRDKGFYFFLDALEKMPQTLAAELNVVFATRFDDMDAVDRINRLKEKFHEIRLYNGYTHDTIRDIVKGVNLGIVPVIWEDNLPQVAMELRAMGIPVLASDRGGASELTKNPAFKFKAGDIESFIAAVKNIKDDRDVLCEYYDGIVPLNTMKKHCDQLETLYKGR